MISNKEQLWNSYQASSPQTQDSVQHLLQPKKILTVDELIAHMQNKGILFNIISKEDAKHYLEHNNYYFKISSYRANYTKKQCGANAGQYENLEFAYLKELSIIDMHLRYLILQMCLDIEHHVKLMLIHEVESNPKEDGYSIVNLFDSNRQARLKILKHANNSYAKDLIEKHRVLMDFPIWSICELIDFGDLCRLYKTYTEAYPGQTTLPKYSFLNPIRNLRNAAAHSNCLIYKLKSPHSSGKIISDISNIVSQIHTISKSNRSQYLCIVPIHDFAVLLYWYSNFVKSSGLLRKRKQELYHLFFCRMTEHRDYFKKNLYIQNAYLFCLKLVIHFFKNY